MKYLKNAELDDRAIVTALHRCISQYENGEIIEVRDELFNIIIAIDEFEKNCE